MAAHVDYESPPNRCPVCGYSLAGLPSEYRCPECGEPYDEQTHVWRMRHGWIWQVSIALPITAINTLVIWYYNTRSQMPIVWIVIVANAISIIALLIPVIRTYRKGLSIALMPNGIFVRGSNGEGLLNWEDFRTAELLFNREVLFRARNNRKSLTTGRGLKIETLKMIKHIAEMQAPERRNSLAQ